MSYFQLFNMATKNSYISAFLFVLRATAFNLYPTINPDNLAKSFGISIDCLDALNETVSCDQTLFQMSNTVDSYLWTAENLTDLCTTDCIKSTSNWWSHVQDRCAMDTIVAFGKMIPADSIAGRFNEGMKIACLQPSSSSNSSGPYSNPGTVPTGSAPFSNITSSSNTSGPYSYPSSVPTSSAPFSNITSTSPNLAPYSNLSSVSNITSSGPVWCLLESQEWIGSDVIRPDCSAHPTDPSCIDPLSVSPENERIANLYPNDMVSNIQLLRPLCMHTNYLYSKTVIETC